MEKILSKQNENIERGSVAEQQYLLIYERETRMNVKFELGFLIKTHNWLSGTHLDTQNSIHKLSITIGKKALDMDSLFRVSTDIPDSQFLVSTYVLDS